MRSTLFGLALAVVLGTRGEAAEATNRVADLAGREAQMVASELIRQNGALREEVAKLRSEIEQLTLSLAQAKASLDAAGRGATSNPLVAAGGRGWQWWT